MTEEDCSKGFPCVLLQLVFKNQKATWLCIQAWPNNWSLACNARAMQLQALPLSWIP